MQYMCLPVPRVCVVRCVPDHALVRRCQVLTLRMWLARAERLAVTKLHKSNRRRFGGPQRAASAPGSVQSLFSSSFLFIVFFSGLFRLGRQLLHSCDATPHSGQSKCVPLHAIRSFQCAVSKPLSR
eukprot:30068-Rhodomonas_salina.1